MDDCTIRVAKTKALISFAVTTKLVCVFVFVYAKSQFSHNEVHIITERLFGQHLEFMTVYSVLEICH